jgi:GntR family transcriptional repressor for pyruvate dehydrogenase complex
MMEKNAVGKVARNRSEDHLKSLRALLDEMEEALKTNDHDRFFDADLNFHAQMMHFAGNETLEGLMSLMNEKIQRIRYLTTWVPQRLERTIVEHADIMDAIVEQQPEKAQAAIEVHIEAVRKGVNHLFEDERMTFLTGAFLSR